jgi:HTH-type transcriptional regulator/antitoxin HigA
MPKRPRPARVPPPSARYLALIRRFPLRPIRDERQLAAASATLDALLARDDLTPAEEDYLDVLGTLVERYEDRHVKIPDVPPAEMLRYLLETRGVAKAELARAAGIDKSTIYKLLSGEFAFNYDRVLRLARHFRVSPAVFFPRIDHAERT